MGITSAWSISAHDDDIISALTPRLIPLIAAERDEPFARERWDRWCREPLPDFRSWWNPFGQSCRREADALDSFLELTASGEHMQKMYDGLSPDDDFSLLTDVWDLVTGSEDIFISVQSKEFALGSFFHAIGPDRALLLPGWCGNFLLNSAEVRQTLPAVERAPMRRASWTDHCGCGGRLRRTLAACVACPSPSTERDWSRRRRGRSALRTVSGCQVGPDIVAQRPTLPSPEDRAPG
ncbi:hypothetical protein [Streptomyces sp. NPDC007856]|uniref:hypothetical protein n=1 Tax=Streptomyces sp. NPDC007856 TaxID=3364781 RepID=UPI003690F3F2